MRGTMLRRDDIPFDLQPRQAWGYMICMISAPADPLQNIYLLGCSFEGIFLIGGISSPRPPDILSLLAQRKYAKKEPFSE